MPKLQFKSLFLIYMRVTSSLLLSLAWISCAIVFCSCVSRAKDEVVKQGYRLFLTLFGIKLHVVGKPASGSVLFVSNHISYTDIVVIGSLVNANFVAKVGVSRWPVIGWIAREIGTLFVTRQPKDAARELQMLQEAALTNNLVLFPEGTSSEGHNVLPFKSSFFQIVNAPSLKDTVVQPISLIFEKISGQPTTRFFRKFMGWRGDLSFFEHMCQLIGLGSYTVCVVFHPPLVPSTYRDRKELAKAAHDQVLRGVRQGINGQATLIPS